MLSLASSLADLPGINAPKIKQLERMGLHCVEDILFHLPRRYEDRTRFDRFPRDESDVAVCVCGTVEKATVKRFQGWKKMFEVVLKEDQQDALSQPLTCRWFNLHFLEKVIISGQRLIVYGKPKLKKHGIVIDQPEFEIVEDDDATSVHLKRIVPVYRATEGMSQRVLRRLTFDILALIPDTAFEERLPFDLDPLPFSKAIREIHFPSSWNDLTMARRHLVLDEFFSMQLFLAARRADSVQRPGTAHRGTGKLTDALLSALPFPLTNAQKRAIQEIARDMATSRPMNRLLHGDVGSGKTLVALSSMLTAVESGSQAALMAPTQILAEQHYLNFRKLLEPLGLSVSLRTGSRDEDAAPLPLFSNCPAKDQSPDIIVGTHALLFEKETFTRLGLVVIDEQHKFGVMQRARLIQQGVMPDVLVMTATPIPRTFTMTIYGDLDVSTLDELPAGRAPIVTALRSTSKLPEAAQFILKHLEAGRQAYIVYPLIEESEKLNAKAATLEYEQWVKLLAPMPVSLLHGRMDPEEKDRVMTAFRDGRTKALVSTTVIEVGIDVPNASIMLVENAERFGLAQLHQLRGRIGRGTHKSFCILLSDAANGEAIEKLQTLERTSNGFEIAEADLRLRGPGDLLGTAQSGLPPLRLGDPLADADLMLLARSTAKSIFESDPKLAKPENLKFRTRIAETRKLILAQVG